MEDIKTLIYCTDNFIDDEIASMVREYHLWAACGAPIISVSQCPIDFGTNVCIGPIGRSLDSLLRQLLKGVEAAQTKYVCVTEHDCIYPMGYFDFKPPEDDVFYYNSNSYLVYPKEEANTTFFMKRCESYVALSQLTVCRDLFLEDLKVRVDKLNNGYLFTDKRGARCEPGKSEYMGIFIHPENETVISLPERKCQFRKNDSPVIDIRHSRNLTKMGSLPPMKEKRIPYWGSYEDVVCKKLIDGENDS